MRLRPRLSAPFATVLGSVMLLVGGCGDDREGTPSIQLTYIKHDGSEHRMLLDKREFEHTPGVTQVISSIGSDDTITVQLYLDEHHSEAGRQKALDLGYHQVRN